MKLYQLTAFIGLFSVCISGQKTAETIAEEVNSKYFEIPRETVYVHLNKSTYLEGEELWFKGYAYDRKNNLPSQYTTNFNVELFDDKGKEVYSGLFLGYYGSVEGNIKIDSTWSSGNYYLRTATNWMNNFIEDDSYTQKITIINEPITKPVDTTALVYDFQLLPEGGHIVANTDNTIGFKLMNNKGSGVPFKNGKILDDKGNYMGSFKSNQFGIGKFIFKPKLGVKYSVSIVLDSGEQIEAAFPKVDARGIAISINNLYEDKVVVEFNTNSATQHELKDKNYYLLVHQNHKSKKVPINFSSDQLKKGIFIDRKELYKGVNMITLFKDNTPVLERIFFNYTKEKDNEIQLIKPTRSNDSLIFTLQAPKRDSVLYDVSISVLPEETKSYNHQDNIHSVMLLNPYLKGYVENPKYYFTNITKKKEYNLDLLLITQGWSRYNWNMIFNQSPKIKYSFNNGLIIKGKIQNARDNTIEQVYLYPTQNNGSRLIDVDDSGSFIIKNYYPEKNEKISVSAVKSNGKMIKTGMYIQIQSGRFKKSFSTPPSLDKSLENNVIHNISVPDYFFDDAESLEEVLIRGKKKQQETAPGLGTGRLRKIDENDANAFINIVDYLERVVGVRLNVDTNASTGINNEITAIPPDLLGGSNLPAVYLDDIQLLDFNILLSILTRDIENVYYDRFGFGGGFNSGNGVIRIYSRKTPFKSATTGGISNKLYEYEAKNGFQPFKEFYNPIYGSYQSPLFTDYGTIHWQPFVNFDESGVGSFKILDTGTRNIKLFIEGMGSDGSFISTAQLIELN